MGTAWPPSGLAATKREKLESSVPTRTSVFMPAMAKSMDDNALQKWPLVESVWMDAVASIDSFPSKNTRTFPSLFKQTVKAENESLGSLSCGIPHYPLDLLNK
jgi:hypothetical protein